MTQILEPSTHLTPARCRHLPAAPVLIRVPALAVATVGGGAYAPTRRRRLRREVRAAGYWLLALIPASVACATWGGSRTPVLLAVNSPDRGMTTVAAGLMDEPHRTVSLSLEPVSTVSPREVAECSVFLSGHLLPADAPEETTHGGY